MASSKSTNKASLAIQIIEGILLFIVGLVIVITRDGSAVLNYVIGAMLLIAGLVLIIVDAAKTKRVVSTSTIVAAGLITLGLIALIYNALPIGTFVIWFSIILGSILIADMVICLAYKRNQMSAIIEGVIGVLLLVFGILAVIPVNGIMTVFYIITGVLLMVLGLLLIMLPVIKKK